MSARKTTAARGYGSAHQKARARWQKIIDRGNGRCWRCGQPIHPGVPWDLGHDDHDRRIYRGPEHQSCNRRAGALRGKVVRRRVKHVARQVRRAATTLKW